MDNPMDKKYVKISAEAQLEERSTCGFRQRLLTRDDQAPASVSRLRIDNAKPHWHEHTHEYYYILNGSGTIHVDGEAVPVSAGDCVWIKPGHMHHAEGDIESLIIGIPPFSEDDLHFDPPPTKT